MNANNQSTEEFNNAKMIVQAHIAFKNAATVKELFTAAVRDKAAGDTSLIQRFQEIMRFGMEENHPQDISFKNISDQWCPNVKSKSSYNYLI